MITPTVTATDLDRCLYCHRLILTAFVYIPAVRGTDLVVPAHARCAELATSNLPDDQLEAARAEHLTSLVAIETLFLGAPVTQPAEETR
jgi:hypothetical protein